MKFTVSKDNLIHIVSTYQEHADAEHFQALTKKGDNLDWLLQGLATDAKFGISTSEEAIKTRKEVFGSN
jgi:hypothetical protein